MTTRIGIVTGYDPALDVRDFARTVHEVDERGYDRAIPPSWIEGLTASGTPDEVVQRVARYREAGVTLPILRPAARHQTPRVIDLFAPR